MVKMSFKKNRNSPINKKKKKKKTLSLWILFIFCPKNNKKRSNVMQWLKYWTAASKLKNFIHTITFTFRLTPFRKGMNPLIPPPIQL